MWRRTCAKRLLCQRAHLTELAKFQLATRKLATGPRSGERAGGELNWSQGNWSQAIWPRAGGRAHGARAWAARATARYSRRTGNGARHMQFAGTAASPCCTSDGTNVLSVRCCWIMMKIFVV